MSERGEWQDYVTASQPLADRVILSLPKRSKGTLPWPSSSVSGQRLVWGQVKCSIPDSLGAEVFLTLPPSCVATAIRPWLFHGMVGDWLFIVCILLPFSAIPRKTQDLVLPGLQCYILLQNECHSLFFLIKQTLHEAKIWNLPFISYFLSLTGFPSYWW